MVIKNAPCKAECLNKVFDIRTDGEAKAYLGRYIKYV